MNTKSPIFSPKTYLNQVLYDNLPPVRKARHKISDEDFNIPDYHEYENILETNYNVSQLKKMCKYYEQKQSGNKNELMKRMYNFLKFSNYAIVVQKNYRKHLVQKYIRAHGPALMKKSMCVNDMDFLTLDSVSTIPHYQFFSYTDKDNFTYCFDICSLYNLYNTNKDETINPYNRNPFPKDMLKQLRTLIRLCRVLHYPVKIDLDEEDTTTLTHQQKVEMKVNNVFQKIDELGNYSDANWYMSLNKNQLMRYLRELFDIWSYRAQLTRDIKERICPPNGAPFHQTRLARIHQESELHVKEFVLSIIEKMVTSGIDESDRNLGAYYCLAALTLVNQDAAQALPWLYQSVVH